MAVTRDINAWDTKAGGGGTLVRLKHGMGEWMASRNLMLLKEPLTVHFAV